MSLWPAPAKLNLFLYITGRRHDGYHNLQTLYQFLDYSDTLDIEVNYSATIVLKSEVAGVTHDDNLIIRAARLLRDRAIADSRLEPTAGVSFAVNKRIPIGGGLGGGSSNAATVLVVLNHLWQTGYPLSTLAELGLMLGADVPVFVYGHAAFAEGVGERLMPTTPPERWYLVAHPGVFIATAQVFADKDLPRNTPVRDINTLLKEPFHNDCQLLVRKHFPEVDELLTWLLKYAPSRLTGTGACVFAEFNTEAAARQMLLKAPAWVQGFVARGLNLSPLHRSLLDHS